MDSGNPGQYKIPELPMGAAIGTHMPAQAGIDQAVRDYLSMGFTAADRDIADTQGLASINRAGHRSQDIQIRLIKSSGVINQDRLAARLEPNPLPQAEGLQGVLPVVSKQRFEACCSPIDLIAVIVIQVLGCQLAVQREVTGGVG